MIPSKIKTGIENSPIIANVTGLPSTGQEWRNLTRTVFERIARKINQRVTQHVIKKPVLIKEFLLFGEDEFENLLFKHGLKNMDQFVEHLIHMNEQKPYNWISGKTLQGYWNNGSAKEKKLNVLLTFLQVDTNEWDNWKNDAPAKPTLFERKEINRLNETLPLLKKHFTGHYYRYYQKTDLSPVLIKTPLIIRTDLKDVVVAETKTLGHQYKSTYMVIRNGALYIECENIDWDEKEIYIFNIGFETNPTVITGVSNTLNRKGQATALKNVLVKQEAPFNYKEVNGIEIPFNTPLDPSSEEAKVIAYFKQGNNIITTPQCYGLDELATISYKQKTGEELRHFS